MAADPTPRDGPVSAESPRLRRVAGLPAETTGPAGTRRALRGRPWGRQFPTPASAPATVRPPGVSTYASRASGEVNAYTRTYGSPGPSVGSASTDWDRGT